METASRRRFLGLAALFPLTGFAARAAQAAEAAACYDPAALPRSQKSLRRSLGYVEQSAEARRQCRLCAFYTAAKGDCGTCQMLSGGPVSAGGVCNSFAAKPA